MLNKIKHLFITEILIGFDIKGVEKYILHSFPDVI